MHDTYIFFYKQLIRRNPKSSINGNLQQCEDLQKRANNTATVWAKKSKKVEAISCKIMEFKEKRWWKTKQRAEPNPKDTKIRGSREGNEKEQGSKDERIYITNQKRINGGKTYKTTKARRENVANPRWIKGKPKQSTERTKKSHEKRGEAIENKERRSDPRKPNKKQDEQSKSKQRAQCERTKSKETKITKNIKTKDIRNKQRAST